LLYLTYEFEWGLYAFAGVLGLPIITLCLKDTKIWIYIAMLIMPVFVYTNSEGLTPADMFFAIFYAGGILMWLFYHILIRRTKVIKNLADWMVIFWFVMMVGNFLVAKSNWVSPTEWFSKFILLITTLMYFPIRYAFSAQKDITRLLIVSAISVTGASFYIFYGYYLGLSDLSYAYQLASTDRSMLNVLTVGAVFGLTMIFASQNRFHKILLLGYTGIVIFGLVFSFARTNYVLLILATGLLFLFIPFRKKIELGRILTVVAAIGIIALFTILGDFSDIFVKLITDRFKSSSKGMKDISLVSRAVEYQVALDNIKDFPIGGNGMAKKISFINPIYALSMHVPHIHNGYLTLAFEYGIPMGLVYLFFYFWYLFKGFFLIFQTKGYWRYMSIAAFLALLSIAIANMMAPHFFYRDGYFAVFMSIAVTGIIIENNPKSITKPKDLANAIK
jgi:O-antigen ligase